MLSVIRLSLSIWYSRNFETPGFLLEESSLLDVHRPDGLSDLPVIDDNFRLHLRILPLIHIRHLLTLTFMVAVRLYLCKVKTTLPGVSA